MIHKHPYVEEVAVIGVADEEWGEVVKAVVNLNPEYKSRVTEEEIIEYCKNRLSGFKRPKSVDFVDELPKTALGKINKNQLSQVYRQKTNQ